MALIGHVLSVQCDLYFRKDFRRYKGAPGDPLTPLFNPVFWSSKSATLWPFLLTEVGL